MKRFHFPLEKVLAFRKRQWEAAAAALESLAASRARLESQCARMREALEEAARRLTLEESLSGGRVAEFHFAQRSARDAIRQIEAALASLSRKIAEQRRVFLEARRNYELVSRLREKRHAEWLAEVSRQEEADATESYLARLAQRRLAVSSRMRPPAPAAAGIPSRCAEGEDAW